MQVKFLFLKKLLKFSVKNDIIIIRKAPLGRRGFGRSNETCPLKMVRFRKPSC